MPVKILQIAPALHGVIGLAVGGKGDSALIGPNPDSFESYSQSG